MSRLPGGSSAYELLRPSVSETYGATYLLSEGLKSSHNGKTLSRETAYLGLLLGRGHRPETELVKTDQAIFRSQPNEQGAAV